MGSGSISPLPIELSNVPHYLLKLYDLLQRSIFLLNTNRIYTKCLQYFILTHLTQPHEIF
jgi:hypothetical protein